MNIAEKDACKDDDTAVHLDDMCMHEHDDDNDECFPQMIQT